MSANSSPRNRPGLMTMTGSFSFAACRRNRYPENIEREVPITMRESASPRCGRLFQLSFYSPSLQRKLHRVLECPHKSGTAGFLGDA